MSLIWHRDEIKDGVLAVRIDRTDRPVNALSRAALEELQQLIHEIRSLPELCGVLFCSGKPGSFIVGADVNELATLANRESALSISRFGQEVFAELEALDVPTVALISGACLGGGLEFALACRYRLCDDDSKTILGTPEVKLGLIPGWGGTVRLPERIGLVAALPMILAGQQQNGRQARSKGLVGDVVPTEALHLAGRQIIAEHGKKGTADGLFRKVKRPLIERQINRFNFLKSMALNKAEQATRKETKGKYPAPMVAIRTLRQAMSASRTEASEFETDAVAKLADNPGRKELMRLCVLSEQAKKPSAELEQTVASAQLENAAVLGAGAMGAGIALLLARKGVRTLLKDLKPEFLARGLKTIDGLLKRDVRRRRLTALDSQRATDRISPRTDYRGFRHADLVIEAVLENLEIKRQVFQELAEATSPQTVLATNTSSLLVRDIAEGTPHPERIVGLHFFNPPHRMPLVEIVRTDITSPEALATAIAAVRRLGKTGVIVGDCVGFLVNRLLAPYMNEAGYLCEVVDDPQEIDRAAVAFGMPMGPLALVDLVGLDVAAHVAQNMSAAYGERMAPAPLWQALKQAESATAKDAVHKLFHQNKPTQLFRHAIEQIRTAKRPTGKQQVPPASQEEMIDRLILPVVNEGARCLAEGVAQTLDDIDLAMVFGAGFAPFRGGPMQYAREAGWENTIDRLGRLAATTGEMRFEPSPALREIGQNDPESDLNHPASPSTTQSSA